MKGWADPSAMRHIPTEIIDEIICHTTIELACALDNQAAIKHFYKPAKHTVTWAAANGFTSVIRWLLKNKPSRGTRQCWERGLRKAVKFGHVNIVRLAHELDVAAFTKDTMDLAAKHGQLQLVRFLHEHRMEGCTTAAMDEAAGRGHIEVLRFLHEHRLEGCTPTAMWSAAFRGYIEVVKFLHHNRPEVIPTHTHERRLEEEVKPLDAAACKGHLEVVQFLHEMKYPCSYRAMDWASAQNHIHVVRYLHKNRKRCSTNALDIAAENGHFEIVRFLHEHRPEGCTFQGIRMARTQGHEDIARYLIDNGVVRDMTVEACKRQMSRWAN